MTRRVGATAAAVGLALALGLAGPSVDPRTGEELGRLRAENARLRHELRVERARSGALRSELARQGRARLERELAWRDLHAQLGRLRGAVDPAAVLAEALDIEVADERRAREEREARAREDLDARRDRAEAQRIALNARLRIEGFDGFDLFDAGLLVADQYAEPIADGPLAVEGDAGVAAGDLDGEGDEDVPEEVANGAATGDASAPNASIAPEGSEPDDTPAFGTGPVVLRLFDHRGSLAGSIVAERLHLEASRSGHSVTIVLTDGHTRVDDRQLPFQGGVYRIPLRHVDPVPFIEGCGPLFDPERTERVVDDGRWSRPALLLTLNRLLEASDRGKRYRLTWLGGVVDGEFREVEITVRDQDGRDLERLIADGLVVEVRDDHVRLVLRDGLVLAGDGAHTPFRDGRRTIVLLDSDPAAFVAAHLPVARTRAADAPVDVPDDGPADMDADTATHESADGPAREDEQP